ncbi:uncharacterized protein LOC141720593 isoform X3 [Apium graveolens]|uniref:uncharacterized protein LOC141720593 isoform X3 n=1 Tax=Apium graveolens TaxID=4045 RepID=UPI003D78BD55
MAGSRAPKRSRFGFSFCLPRKSMGRDSRIHLRNDARAPNCMVSILYAIRAKKGLQNKRLGSGRKHVAGAGASEDDEASTDKAHKPRNATADMCLLTEAPGKQDRASEHGSVTKSSMKSRIKSKFSDEMSKKKGWHRRSNSLPSSAPSKRTDFSTHSGFTDFDYEFDMKREGKKSTDDHPCGSTTSYPLPTDPTDESVKKNKMCELCAAKLSMSYWKRRESNREVRHSIESNPFLQDNIVDSDRFSEGSSVQDANQIMDGRDVFGPRKDFFLKILHDPGTPLLQYLHSREALKSKIGLTKSASFPLPGSVSRIVLESTNKNSKGSASNANERENSQVCHRPPNSVDVKLSRTTVEPSIVERKEVGTSESFLRRHKSFNSLTPCSPRGLKIEHENTPVVKRFKKLRSKISRAIRESRKEKQHPIMNSVIQNDNNASKVMQEETDNLQKNVDTEICTKYSGSSGSEVDQSTSALRKDCDNHRFKRATTFGYSMDRYSRLFECTFDRGDRLVSEESTLRAENVPTPGKSSKKTLERLFSLPNLRSYSTVQMDSYPSLAEAPLKTSENHVDVTEPEMFDEKKPLDCSVDQDSQKRLDPTEDSATEEELKECNEAPTQSVNLNAGENFESTSVPSEPSPCTVDDSDSKEITSSPSQPSIVEVVDNAVDIPKEGLPLKQCYRELLQTQVDTKHVQEFNYIKDILELSGFTGSKFLGTWNSTSQPVDPSVFETVEGCPLTEFDISENEEVCIYNRLLMFDLINEVLIEIHDRSSSYFPVPLTCQSRISPMPVGYHVLGEVWINMKWYLNWRPESYQSLDDAVGRDLDRGDGWMNLQFDAECVGLEIEDMVFDELIDEMLYDDLLED